MTEDAKFCLDMAEEKMEHAISHLEKELQKIRAGKANPNMLSGVRVDYYGVSTPLEQTSNINTPDPRQIIIQPFDKSMIHEIDKAILNANLGFNPQNEGEIIRIQVPPLTEERRLELVKKTKEVGEETKIGIRNARKHANDEAKELQNDGLSEDDAKHLHDDIQKLTDKFIDKVDKEVEIKGKDVMTV